MAKTDQMWKDGANIGLSGEGRWAKERPNSSRVYDDGGRVGDALQTAVSDGRWHTSLAWPAKGGTNPCRGLSGKRVLYGELSDIGRWGGAHALPHSGIRDKDKGGG